MICSFGYLPDGIAVGDIGLLHIMPLEGEKPIPCEVTQLTEMGVVVQFLDACPVGLSSRLKISGKFAV